MHNKAFILLAVTRKVCERGAELELKAQRILYSCSVTALYGEKRGRQRAREIEWLELETDLSIRLYSVMANLTSDHGTTAQN